MQPGGIFWATKSFTSWLIQGWNSGASLLSYSLATTVQDLASSSALAPFFMITWLVYCKSCRMCYARRLDPPNQNLFYIEYSRRRSTTHAVNSQLALDLRRFLEKTYTRRTEQASFHRQGS